MLSERVGGDLGKGNQTQLATKRRARPLKAINEPTTQLFTASLGKYAEAVQEALAQARAANVIERIWQKDASVWKTEAPHNKIINNSLGWLTVANEMLAVAGELEAFARSVVEAKRFQYAMVCGMGGSSLCPEVLRQTFGKQAGFPELLVLDSTDPDAIQNLATQINIERCLFIIASKSGTTTEPLSFQKHWYNELKQRTGAPGGAFIAITDPGSYLADTARTENFRRIFLNQPDIGGRYSALSYFGMVPAALMGLDLQQLLGGATKMAAACGADVAVEKNPGALLGAIMAECCKAGRNKLTIITDNKLSAVGLWIEQLIAESTGKEGQGIVPVVDEPLGAVSTYGDDRLFVSVSIGVLSDETRSFLEQLENAGHPVIYRKLTDVYDLGAEFFLWEIATALAGWRMGINPFDQPNVQESKDATKALLDVFTREGKLSLPSPLASDGILTIYADRQLNTPKAGAAVADVLREHVSRIKAGDYVALLAYLEETPEIDNALQAIRTDLRNATQCATTTGYGPRFLHSTGQLHKGGPDTGVFIQLTAPDTTDMPVPGEPYTFGVLKDAQAQGDFESLLSHGRRAIRIDVGKDVVGGLQKLRSLLH